MMKIDFSGLEPSSSIKERTDELCDEICGPPCFKLPTTLDVSIYACDFMTRLCLC